MFDETESALGKVTHLVNSAGITGKSSPLAQAPLEVIRATIEINLMGTILSDTLKDIIENNIKTVAAGGL